MQKDFSIYSETCMQEYLFWSKCHSLLKEASSVMDMCKQIDGMDTEDIVRKHYQDACREIQQQYLSMKNSIEKHLELCKSDADYEYGDRSNIHNMRYVRDRISKLSKHKERILKQLSELHNMDELSDPPIKYRNHDVSTETQHIVPGNQYTHGATGACTSISLVCAALMREKRTIKEITENMNWMDVLTLGSLLWKNWRNNEGKCEKSHYQTLEQIYKVRVMKNVFVKLGGRPIEYGGYIDGRIPEMASRGLDEQQKEALSDIYISLERAIEDVVTLGRGSVGIVTISIYSVSFWSDGNKENPRFALYDSHGNAKGNSILYVLDGVRALVNKICFLCKSSSHVSVGSLDVTKQYCMYLFGPVIQE